MSSASGGTSVCDSDLRSASRGKARYENSATMLSNTVIVNEHTYISSGETASVSTAPPETQPPTRHRLLLLKGVR